MTYLLKKFAILDKDHINVTDDYAILIPSYVVLDNMLADVIAELNITTNLVVIYDKKYRMFLGVKFFDSLF
jgi:hypothetical protein